jgi:hypothetical protein
MSSSDQASNVNRNDERLLRAICYAGFAALPLLTLFVHLLLIYHG